MSLQDRLEQNADVCPHCGGDMPCAPCTRNARKAGTSRKDGTLTAVLPVGEPPDRAAVAAMLSSRGYRPDEWRIVTLTVNQWESLRRLISKRQVVNEPIVLSQTKAVLERIVPDDQTDWGRFLAGLGGLTERKPLRRLKPEPSDRNRLYICLGDDQAPFVNWPLHELTCEALADLKPDGLIYMGDGPDFGRLSRYAKPGTRWDTAVQEDLNILHRVLAERLENVGSDRWYLQGNHEWRLTKQLRAKLPALLGVKQAGTDGAAVLSVENLARLADLGLTVISDDRGDYPYGTLNLTPDLTVTHGWLTRRGAGASALASASHLKGSLIVGHTHRLAVSHVTRWDGEQEQVDTVGETGTMSDLQGLGYTQFPDWQPGWLTALIRPDGSHHVESAIYRDGTLRWRDRQWKITARGVRP